MVLAGRAAKNKRRSELVARGVTDADILDEMTTSVGLSGVPFVVDVASRKGKLPTSTLPVGYELRQVIGQLQRVGLIQERKEGVIRGWDWLGLASLSTTVSTTTVQCIKRLLSF